MAIIELNLHRNYVSEWDTWCGIREVMQNAMDEHDEGHPISVEHRDGVLSIGNEGSELKVEALLMGHTTKSGNSQSRGKYGEGLDLALLVLSRSGFDISVFTPTETWQAMIERSKTYDAEVLFVKTRRAKTRRLGTTITIGGVTDELWAQVKFRFLDFQAMDETECIHVGSKGDLLLSPAHAGKVYVKGIYVQDDPDLRFGYNLNDVTLDRDRRMVSSFDLKWETSRVLSSATAARPELLSKKVFNLLSNDAKDTSGFSTTNMAHKAKGIIAEEFKKEHGENTIPVSDMGESEEVESLGGKSVIAPPTLRAVLVCEIETPQELRAKASKDTEKAYAWGDLEDKEKEVLKWASNRVQSAVDMFRGNHSLCLALSVSEIYGAPEGKVMSLVKVVDFRQSSTLGLYRRKSNEIELSKKCLANDYLALRVLIHEMGHMISGRGDATVGNQLTIEALWTAVCYTNS